MRTGWTSRIFWRTYRIIGTTSWDLVRELQPPSDAALQALWEGHLTALGTEGSRWTLEPGQTLGRRARMEGFGGAIFGRIQPSNSSPNVFVYSDPQAGTTYGYNFDGWNADRTVFLYTGEGRTGDQRMRSGNAALLNHRDTGRAVQVFVADGTEEGSGAKVQRHLGEFEVSPDRPTLTAEAPDQDGVQRTVLVFRLLPIGTVLRRDQDESAIGDAPATTQAERVDVDTAELPGGYAEAVPIEAVRAHAYPVAGSTAATAVKREAELVTRYQKHLEKRGATCVRYKLAAPPAALRRRAPSAAPGAQSAGRCPPAPLQTRSESRPRPPRGSTGPEPRPNARAPAPADPHDPGARSRRTAPYPAGVKCGQHRACPDRER